LIYETVYSLSPLVCGTSELTCSNISVLFSGGGMSSAMQAVSPHSLAQVPSQYAPTSSPRPQQSPRRPSRQQGDNGVGGVSPANNQQPYTPSAVNPTMSTPPEHSLPLLTHPSPVTPVTASGSGSTRARP